MLCCNNVKFKSKILYIDGERSLAITTNRDGDVEICSLRDITTFVSSYSPSTPSGQCGGRRWPAGRRPALSSTIAVIPFQGNQSIFCYRFSNLIRENELFVLDYLFSGNEIITLK